MHLSRRIRMMPGECLAEVFPKTSDSGDFASLDFAMNRKRQNWTLLSLFVLTPVLYLLSTSTLWKSTSTLWKKTRNSEYPVKLVLRFLTVAIVLIAELATAQPPATSAPPKKLPLPGENFLVSERPAFVIPPNQKPTSGETPWVWYAPTLRGLPGTEERWMFERFTKAGIAIAGIDVGESYGSPDGRKVYSEFYRELTEKRGFARKPVLLGRSRGGLMTLNWAAENADKVGGFAGIYPVCNLASYPGITKASPAFHMTPEELTKCLAEHNPLDRLAPLAKAKVPLFAIHGDVDQPVPLTDNSGEMRKRYTALGGKMTLIISAGQGHNMWSGFFQSQELVNFVIERAKVK